MSQPRVEPEGNAVVPPVDWGIDPEDEATDIPPQEAQPAEVDPGAQPGAPAPADAAASFQGDVRVGEVEAVPVPAEGTEETPEDRSSTSKSFADRLHLTLNGGFVFGGQHFVPEKDPFKSATPITRGGFFGVQPTIAIVDREHFNLRAGLDWHGKFLGTPSTQGQENSGYSAHFVGGLLEFNANFVEAVGMGGNLGIGYLGLVADNADVGAPFTATLDWGDQGGIALPAQLYLHFWNNAFRLGGQADFVVQPISLPTAEGQPDLKVDFNPAWTLFAGIEVGNLIRNVSGGKKEQAAARAESAADSE